VLQNAAAHGLSAGVMCCLLKAGADATAVNFYNDTAADVAQAYKHSATAALLSRAERDQLSTHQQWFAPMPCVMHLLINPDCPGWRCSTDMALRVAVLGHLSEMALFGSQQPDKFELVQCVEFELYSAATDLAEFGDLSTVQQRAEVVYDTQPLLALQRAAAVAAKELQSEAAQRDVALSCGSTSSAEADNAQRRSDDGAVQHLHSNAVLTKVTDQHSGELVDDARGSDCETHSCRSGDNDYVQTVEIEEQHQQ
jgi:hypothetical protein